MSPFDIIAITLPISLLMALGAVSVWRGWFPAEAIPGFGKFVRNMALPSAVFLAVSQRDFSEIIHPGFILAFGGASLFSLCLSLLVARGVLRQPLSLAGIVGLAGGVSNALMIGLPLVVALYGVDAMAAIAQQLIVETAFLIPLGLLIDAIEQSLADGVGVTDEASAIEYMGLSPMLIAGRADNIKVTRPEDLALAELFLQQKR